MKKQPPLPKDRRVFTIDGREVLITYMCLKCHRMRPLRAFGLRRMPDNTIRNIPWCKPCRSGSKKKEGVNAALG